MRLDRHELSNKEFAIKLASYKEKQDHPDKDKIHEAMRYLNKTQMFIIKHYFFDEKNYSDISKLLKVTRQTVKYHLKRAYKVLRKNFRQP